MNICYGTTSRGPHLLCVLASRYYALVALQSPEPSVRVSGLAMLTEVRS